MISTYACAHVLHIMHNTKHMGLNKDHVSVAKIMPGGAHSSTSKTATTDVRSALALEVGR
jgi:hypothetical protein